MRDDFNLEIETRGNVSTPTEGNTLEQEVTTDTEPQQLLVYWSSDVDHRYPIITTGNCTGLDDGLRQLALLAQLKALRTVSD